MILYTLLLLFWTNPWMLENSMHVVRDIFFTNANFPTHEHYYFEWTRILVTNDKDKSKPLTKRNLLCEKTFALFQNHPT